MTRTLLFLIPVLACAQSADVLKQGELVFSKSCATGYCHGARGTAGGAPRLAARGFDQPYINTTVSKGVANAGMPAFAATLSNNDLAAVVAYVANLNGVTSAATVASGPRSLTGDAARGRALFSEATRSFGRCSTCHEVDGIGISVATPITAVPANVAALKALATPQVSTATIGGESLPILMVSKKVQGVTFYDLTTPPPVLRTEIPATVQTKDDSTWRHSSVIGGYSDAELTAILTYLRAVVRP